MTDLASPPEQAVVGAPDNVKTKPRKNRRTREELLAAGVGQRSNGEGTIIEIETPYGKRFKALKTLYVVGRNAVRVSGTGTTRQEAFARLRQNELKRLVLQGELPVEALNLSPREVKTTFSEVAWQWYEWKKTTKLPSHRITPTVAQKYEQHLKNHILPVLGEIPIRLMTTENIHDFMFVKLPAKKKMVRNAEGVLVPSSTPLLGQSIQRGIQGVVSMITAYARKKKIITVDPSFHVDKIGKPQNTRKGLADRRDDLYRFVEHIHNTPNEGKWILAAYGVRKSERLGLTWDCFTNLNSPNRATLEIRQQLVRNPDTGKLEILQTTKSESSKRLIPLDERIRKPLLAHKAVQEKMKQQPAWKQPKEYEGLVYTTSVGTPISHSKDNTYWHRVWASVSDRNDAEGKPVPALEPLQLHAVRHLAISILVAGGVPLEHVRAIAGHESDAITRAVYTHLSVKDKVEPVKKLTDMLYGRVEQKNTAETTAVAALAAVRKKQEQQDEDVTDA